jgi:acyl-CoA dehydrogenase
MDEHIYPAESRYAAEIAANTAAGKRWTPLQTIENSSPRRRPPGCGTCSCRWTAEASGYHGAGLTNQEYAPLAEIMGRVLGPARSSTARRPTPATWRPLRYGTRAQGSGSSRCCEGEIRGGFAMTEPAVASSDATNIEARIERQGDDYVINGRKWWTSGAGDPRCKV